MLDKIVREIQRIEKQYDVRVLLAVESGSRAWGFASPDSDYDVRCIYVHRPDWYLSVFEPRDVIEAMLPDMLDVSGWELRKTLRLFAKCNLALNEWLGSPVVYWAQPQFRAELQALVPTFFNAIGAIHHYRSMAQTALMDNLQDRSIGIKKLFYVLRPLLACRWIERSKSQPPTEFASLVAAPWVTSAEREWIATLLEIKVRTLEREPVQIPAQRLDDIQQELERFKSVSEGKTASRNDFNVLDELLRRWVRKVSEVQD